MSLMARVHEDVCARPIAMPLLYVNNCIRQAIAGYRYFPNH